MVNKLLLLLVLIISCDNDPCPDMNKPITPRPSNCTRDDSLPFIKFRSADRFGDTTNTSTVATLNYYTTYIGQTNLIYNNDSIFNLVSKHYYNNIPDCVTSFLIFRGLNLTKDTINLNYLNSSIKSSFAFLDCDSLLDVYKLDTSKYNYFLFTSIDKQNKFLTAEFHCQFVKDHTFGSHNSWEVLRFCDGKIRLKY